MDAGQDEVRDERGGCGDRELTGDRLEPGERLAAHRAGGHVLGEQAVRLDGVLAG